MDFGLAKCIQGYDCFLQAGRVYLSMDSGALKSIRTDFFLFVYAKGLQPTPCFTVISVWSIVGVGGFFQFINETFGVV